MASAGWLWSNPWNEECLKAEENLLNSRDWKDTESWKVTDVPIVHEGESHHIHTISTCAHNKVDSASPIVLWHGFGQSAASFWQNLPGLARGHHSHVYACDWLGAGLSSRPTWTTGDHPRKAEVMFVESMEQWRKHQGIDKMHLVAHSLSAFFAIGYAEKYPQHIASLILASPAGVPPPPPVSLHSRIETLPWGPRRLAIGVGLSLWETGLTPQSAVRTAGSWIGKGLFIDTYVSRRFPPQVPSKDLFAEYMYWSFHGEISAENALNAILHPGAIAKEPLGERIPFVKENIPVSFVYGNHDWMNSNAAVEVAAVMNRGVEVKILDKCGHQLYIEQPQQFNEFVLNKVAQCSDGKIPP